jgi:hypothetical protein
MCAVYKTANDGVSNIKEDLKEAQEKATIFLILIILLLAMQLCVTLLN